MKRTLALLLSLIMVVFAFTACQSGKEPASTDSATNTSSAPETSAPVADETPTADNIRVYALKGPTGMGMSKLMDDFDVGKSKLKYSFTIAGAPDEITAEIIKGNFDIAAVPTNLAAVLHSKAPEKVQVAAVNTLGVLYILENGSTINSIEDLNGKTLYATGKGSTPEYILNYVLKAFNVDCTVEYVTEHSELATKMAAGDVAIGMLPVPNATTVLAKSEARVALNLTELWKEAAAKNGDNSALYQGCIIINKEFAAAHPTDLNMFLKEYESSVKFVNENIDEASAIIEKYGIVPAAAIAKKAIPDANIVFITGDEMINGLKGFYKVLFDFAPASVGGTLPDDSIFYTGK